MTVYFLIPVYNESRNIELLHRNLCAALPGQTKFYVFADDGSTDDSVGMLQRLFKDTDHNIITKPENSGPGDSFNRGFEWILEHSDDPADVVVTLEADNTSDPGILPHMFILSGLGYDLVLASVYAQGGGFQKTSFFRLFISFFANMIFRTVFNLRVLTLSSFYRVYHTGLLRRVQERYGQLITENGFICMLEILIRCIRVNATIIEVPMTLKSDNRSGRSKMKILKTTMNYLRFLFLKRK